MVDFNPESFLESQYEEELSTSVDPCPEGNYPGQINDVDAKTIEITKGDRAGESAVVMSVIWEVLDDAVRAQLDRPNVRVKQDFFIDLDAAGQISTEKGKNVRLGRLLEALDLNGKKWSPKGLIGQTAMIRVVHRADKNDPEIKYAEVANVAPMK